jgi:hypothetical protein
MKDNKGITKGTEPKNDLNKHNEYWVELEKEFGKSVYENEVFLKFFEVQNVIQEKITYLEAMVEIQIKHIDIYIKYINKFNRNHFKAINTGVKPGDKVKPYIIKNDFGYLKFTNVAFKDLKNSQISYTSSAKEIAALKLKIESQLKLFRGNKNKPSPKKNRLLQFLRENKALLNLKNWKYQIAIEYENKHFEPIGDTLIYECRKEILKELGE